MSHAQLRFQKPARTPAQLVAHLTGKGLSVPNSAAAEQAIGRIGFYRLLIYMRPFQDPVTRRFLAGKTFEDVLDTYIFDSKLRTLCMDGIAKVEVALRAAVVNELAVQHSAHFYTRSRHFERPSGFVDFMNNSVKANGVAVDHYYSKYNDPPLPPIWTVLETVSFGVLSRLYSNLHVKNRKMIARSFTYQEEILVSWYRAITFLRNRCAHHARVWNFVSNSNTPQVARSIRTVFGASQNTFYARAVALNALLRDIDPASTWHTDLRNLIAAHPNVLPADMGFPVGWDAMPFWT